MCCRSSGCRSGLITLPAIHLASRRSAYFPGWKVGKKVTTFVAILLPLRRLILSGFAWIVDPLDGTNNYLRGYPGWAVSICLRNGDAPVVGVVFDPSADLTYSATRGGGAHRNGYLI